MVRGEKGEEGRESEVERVKRRYIERKGVRREIGREGE